MGELKKLGRYELRRVLGKGAMGVVYEGYDPTLSRRVAVKTILKSVAHDDETERNYAERFVREAKAVARLNHPNIIQVFDFGVENEVAYLVMEFIQGRELRDFFTAGEAFEARETIRIMGELLDALEFAHEAGVIHRDVKPANVMLDGQRRVKLADFGVARVQDSDRSAAGTMVGTPAFMSPEQISGGKVDRRTDIFSAGTIFYQLLTGEQPFKGEGAWTVAKQIMQDDPPAPSSVMKSVSPAFDAIVDKALAKNPAQRFASAGEFAASLRGAPGAVGLPPKPKAKPELRASEAEVEFWRSIQNSADPAEFEFYLEQFPEGTYAGLARHKIARLRKVPDAQDTVRLEAEAQAKLREAEELAKQREAEELAKRREAEEQAKLETMEKALRESAERARLEAAERAKRVAEEKAKYEAAEKAKREAEEKARRAAALERLKQQEEAAARAKAAVDEDATVGIGSGKGAEVRSRAAERKQSYVLPFVAVAIVVAGAVGAYLVLGRKPASAPAEEAPAQAGASAPTADVEKIRRETEERLRKEFAEKAAAERAALEKAVIEKVNAERAAAEKVSQAKTSAERASAEKVAAAAAAERIAAEKAAAAKASERASAERAAAERAVADKAAADKVVAEKAAAEKAAAEKAAADKAAAEKLAANSPEAQLERFTQRVGRDKVLKQTPPLPSSLFGASALQPGEVVYVNDGSCPTGRIREVTGTSTSGGGNLRERPSRCISLDDGGSAAARPPAAKPAAAAPAAAAPPVAADADARLQRFIQRVGSNKVLKQEPPLPTSISSSYSLQQGEVAYVNDGSCGPGRIKEIAGVGTSMGGTLRIVSWPSRCIPLE